MVPKINSSPFQGQLAYTQPANQAAWRQEMLEQVLQKVREVRPVVEKGVALSTRAEIPAKGGLIDTFA